MSETVLQIEGLEKSFGALRATCDVSLDVAHGEIHALIGPNGAGKTTLIRQIYGSETSDAGVVKLRGEVMNGLTVPQRVARGIGRSFQISNVLMDFTVLQNAILAEQARRGESFRFFRPAFDDQALIEGAGVMLDRVGLGDRAATPVADLAHGERRLLELALALASEPALLLLDEPTAGINPTLINGLIDRLQRANEELGITLCVIEHNMRVIMNLASDIYCLANGRMLASGAPEELQNDQRVIDAYLGGH